MHDEEAHHSRLTARQRGVEAVVLAALIDAHPCELEESQVRRDLTSVDNTPDRVAAIDQAIDGLVDVGLVARDAERFRLTPPAVRAKEFDLGL
jgi:hypothetical protein